MKVLKTDNTLNVHDLERELEVYIWGDVDPCEVFLRPLHSRLLIVQTNHVSDNNVPLGSATASTRSWWMDQSCTSKLLRGLRSCAVH